ncbi:MAG: hypothetical protein GDA53_01460, partial [Rhodobacteraceae bacterium]|nr:hypothetical protein [Paracoccaceae bacterium]
MTAFDTTITARALESTGLSHDQAEIIARTSGEAVRATRADIDLLQANINTKIAEVRTDIAE